VVKRYDELPEPSICEAINPTCDDAAEWRVTHLSECSHNGNTRVFCSDCKKDIVPLYEILLCSHCYTAEAIDVPMEITWEHL
jgi:hypothetical protein